MQDGVGCTLGVFAEFLGAESDIQGALGGHQGDFLVRDFALNGRLLREAGENLLQAVRIEAAAGHVLGAAEIAAVCQKDFHSGIGKNICGCSACQSSSYDYGVKFFFAHSFLLL